MSPISPRTVFTTAPSINEVQKRHKNIALLLVIGNDNNALNNILTTVSSIHVLKNPYDDNAQLPSNLQDWSYGTRDEHPMHFLRSCLSSMPTSSSSEIILVSVKLDKYKSDIILSSLVTSPLFSVIVVATMSQNYMLSFANERAEEIDRATNVPFGDVLEQALKQPTIQDIQSYFESLKRMEKDIKCADKAFRGHWPKRENVKFVDCLDNSHIIYTLFNGCKVAIKSDVLLKHESSKNKPEKKDAWELLANSCQPDVISRLRFTFEGASSVSNFSLRSKVQSSNELLLSAPKENGLSTRPKVHGDEIDGEEERAVWALLVVVTPENERINIETTRTTIESASLTLSSRLNTYIAVTPESDSKAISEQLETNLKMNLENNINIVYMNFEELKLCRAWDNLAKRAVDDGCNRILFSDGFVSVHTRNWPEILEESFKSSDSICIGIPPHEDNDNNDDVLATVALHKKHIDIFGTVFPGLITDRGAEAFLQQVWDRSNKYMLPLNSLSISSCRKIITAKVNGLGWSRRREPSINFKDHILESALRTIRRKTHYSIYPRLDVIVPTYRVNLLELERILSLRLINTLHCRIQFWVIIDNPSHPNKHVLLSKYDRTYLDQDRNYYSRIIIQPENLGASLSRNTGLMKSNSDFAILLDDDVIASENVIDEYASITSRHPNADIFAGVTNLPIAKTWWEKSLIVSTLSEFYGSPKYLNEPAWPVTANACVRVRRITGTDKNEGIVSFFGAQFPKTGGGEDIEIGMRTRGRGGKLVCVPLAQVSHPWFGGSAYRALVHIAKWMTGDCHITEGLSHTQTVFFSFPGWVEIIVITCIPILICFGLVKWLKVTGTVFMTELIVRTLGMARRAYRVDGRTMNFIRVALFASILQMTQDVVRVSCHLSRARVDCLFKRLDLYDGLRSTTPMRLRLLAKCMLMSVIVALMLRA